MDYTAKLSVLLASSWQRLLVNVQIAQIFKSHANKFLRWKITCQKSHANISRDTITSHLLCGSSNERYILDVPQTMCSTYHRVFGMLRFKIWSFKSVIGTSPDDPKTHKGELAREGHQVAVAF